MSINTDRAIGRLLETVDKLVGLQNTIVVFTADHGVAPVPETLQAERMPGGRLTNPEFFAPVIKALEDAFGPGSWLLSTAGSSPYFDTGLMEQKKVDPSQAQRIAARVLYRQPHVARVYSRDQLLDGYAAADRFDLRVARSFHPQRSGDLEVVLDPFWIRGRTGATHGSPYLYDSHIPLILMGPGIQPGTYRREVALNDVAPTLSTLLDVETPSGATGRVLTELFDREARGSGSGPARSSSSGSQN